MSKSSAFDSIADRYDSWFDTPEGAEIFAEEVECLRLLQEDFSGCRLETGVGTGRFAEALGIHYGIDLSPQMASKAARRGVEVLAANSEKLPFRSQSFDGVLMALRLCFLKKPEKSIFS